MTPCDFTWGYKQLYLNGSLFLIRFLTLVVLSLQWETHLKAWACIYRVKYSDSGARNEF